MKIGYRHLLENHLRPKMNRRMSVSPKPITLNGHCQPYINRRQALKALEEPQKLTQYEPILNR